METVLRTEGLEKRFGPVRAVDGVSLAVERGEVFGFLGPNGAGKTTTIGMVLGLIHPTAGEVFLFGEPLTPARPGVLRRVGALVGATAALVPYLSARGNLRLVARLQGAKAAARIDERSRRGDDASDADASIARSLAAEFDPWPAAIEVDTSPAPDDVVRAVRSVLGQEVVT